MGSESHDIGVAVPVEPPAAVVAPVPEEPPEAALSTVGRQQARRFNAAARLTPGERDVVIRFVTDMANELSLTHAPWATGLPH